MGVEGKVVEMRVKVKSKVKKVRKKRSQRRWGEGSRVCLWREGWRRISLVFELLFIFLLFLFGIVCVYQRGERLFLFLFLWDWDLSLSLL